MATRAVFNQFTNPKALNNFNTVECVHINLSPGIWMLHGKFEITNWDNDPQNANADLIVEDQNNMVVDHATLRIPGGAISQTVYLQGLIATTDIRPGLVKISASTFNGMSSLPSLIAVSVDQSNQSPSP